MRSTKFSSRLSTVAFASILAGILTTSTISSSLAQQTASLSGSVKRTQKDSSGTFSSEDFGDTSGQQTIEQQNHLVQTKSQLTVDILVPHYNKQVNNFMLYPYPIQPPRIKKLPMPLPTKAQGLKSLLIATGYDRKQVPEIHAYPFQGWRWQYAYREAVKKAGLFPPLILLQMYTWADKMVPYARVECERWNDIEDERQKRYLAANEEFVSTRADVETDAVRKGMYPMDLRINRLMYGHLCEGKISLQPGNWWVVGSHKVPGLTYYWQLPVTLQEGEPNKVELTEENALVIEGGW